MGLHFAVLGPLRVWDGADTEVKRPSHRRLLSILLLEYGHRQATDGLIDRYWGENAPANAKATLQTHISALRRLLPRAAIVTEGYGYALESADSWVDTTEFTRCAELAQRAARDRAWQPALEAVERALALWRGHPFPELRDDGFAQPEIVRLQELKAELLELRVEAMIATGRDVEILPDLERLVVEYPLRERLWEHLMVARYHSGRHAEALRAYRQARDVFAEMGLEPGRELRRLESKILRHDVGLRPEPRHNLPIDLTSFIGRDEELGDVGELLTRHRMVTLTGVGGSGKTRLARRAAGDGLDAFPDGCWFLQLAPLRDPDLVIHELVSTMGLKLRGEAGMAALQAAVATETMLVLLDNCEHLLAASAELARALMEAGPDVTVLATSREALKVPGEVVYHVPPMKLPDADDGPLDLASLRSSDAVRLFEDRARLARPGYTIEDRDAAAVLTICQRLDAVPLAIELAAARIGALGVGTIADRLEDRFRLLTGGSSTTSPRQQTLEATVTWSYELLTPAEQAVFARLSVFRGGFDLEMAEQIGAGNGIDPADVLALVAGLVGRSLVSTVDAPVGRRYRLLETLREYARERLESSGDGDRVRHRHRDWCVAFATDIQTNIYRGGHRELRQRLAVEIDNLRAALEWGREAGGGPEIAPLAGALAWYWAQEGRVALAISHLEVALEACVDTELEAELRSRLGREQFRAGEVAAAAEQTRRAYQRMAGAEPSAIKAGVLSAHARLIRLLIDHDPGEAVPIAREAVATAEAIGDAAIEIRTRSVLGSVLGWSGRIDEGLEHQRTALDVAVASADPALTLEMYATTLDLLFLHPTQRRDAPERITDQLLAWLSENDDHEVEHHAQIIGWIPYVFLQTGKWDQAERAIDRMGDAHLEGYERTWHLMLRSTLRWMQGRLGEARADLAGLRRFGVNPRWYHDYFPLLADVAADQGRLAEVRAFADDYLAVEVDTSEEAKKLAVLGPLVRAEIDAALTTIAGTHSEHLRRARSAAARMRELLEANPPPTDGSLQLETPSTYLALAEAELSRVTGPAPERWLSAAGCADYVYFRLYAGWRAAEAMAEAGRHDDAVAQIDSVGTEAREVGAERICAELEALARV